MTEIRAGRRTAVVVGVCAALVACRSGASRDAHCREVDAAASAHAGPQAAALAYAAALEEGRLEEAFRLLDPAHRGSEEQFRARYAQESSRRARAAQVRASATELQLRGGSLTLVDSDGWRVVDLDTSAARETLRTFLDAVAQEDFARAYTLLSGEWRARYTPERLEEDFKAEPLAGERLARARVALDASPPAVQAGAVLFSIGDGKAVRLVPEGGTFRVAALE